MTPKEELEKIRTEIAALEERRRALYAASVAAPVEEKVCDDWMAETLGAPPFGKPFTFPVEVHGITYSGELVQNPLFTRTKPGAWVKVRPCAADAGGKTYLGIYLGGLALSLSCRHHQKTGVFEVAYAMHNPAMFVPALGRIVFGAESWWAESAGPDDLREITGDDIDGVWYVQALKALSGDGAPGERRP